MRKRNGLSATKGRGGGGGGPGMALAGIATKVAAAASVPASSTVTLAFCMAVPEPGQTIRVTCLGKSKQKVKRVALLGHGKQLKWKQTDEALEITCPQVLPCKSSVVFRIK